MIRIHNIVSMCRTWSFSDRCSNRLSWDFEVSGSYSRYLLIPNEPQNGSDLAKFGVTESSTSSSSGNP